MGTFGTGPFENDSALDLRDELNASTIEKINVEVDKWESLTDCGERAYRDLMTMPALAQYVINLKIAIPLWDLEETAKRILPCLDETLRFEINADSAWVSKRDHTARVDVLRQIKRNLESLIQEMDRHFAAMEKARAKDGITKDDLEETLRKNLRLVEW